MRFNQNQNNQLFFDEESQIAKEFIEDTHSTKINSVLYWLDTEKNEWKNDLISENCEEFIQKFLPEKKPSFVKNVYKKIRSYSPESKEEIYKKPTLFLNNKKYEFENGEWNEKEEPITTFNQFNIKLNIDETSPIYSNTNFSLDRFVKLLWPDENVRKWALANYATVFMPLSFEKMIFNYGQGRDGKSTVATLISNILKNLSSAFRLNDDDKFSMTNFVNKTVLIDNDFDANKDLNLETLKIKTTKGNVEIESKNKDKKTIYNRSTLFVNSNFLPKFNDISNATERRLAIVLFENSMETNPKDNWFKISEMEELLQDENFQHLFIKKCMKNFKELYDEVSGEIKIPEKIEKITKEVCERNNVIFCFLANEKIDEILKENGEISLTDLYEKYKYWCCENQIRGVYSKRNFNQTTQIVLLNKFKIQTEKIEEKTANSFTVKLINLERKIEKNIEKVVEKNIEKNIEENLTLEKIVLNNPKFEWEK